MKVIGKQITGWIRCFGPNCTAEFKTVNPQRCPRLSCRSTDLRVECLGCGTWVHITKLNEPCRACAARLAAAEAN